MPGLVDDSVTGIQQGTTGLAAAASAAAQHQIQELQRRKDNEAGLGSLAGAIGGLYMSRHSGSGLKQRTSPSLVKGAGLTGPSDPDKSINSGEAAGGDPGSMLIGAMGQRMQGGLLNNNALPPSTGGSNSSPWAAESEDE